MTVEDTTREELIQGLETLRARVAELESAETERKQAEDLLCMQHDLAIALGSTSELKEALDLVLRTALQIDGIDSGGVYVVDGKTGALELMAHRGLPLQFVESASHYDADSPQARLVMAGKVVYGLHSEISAAMDEVFQQEALRAVGVIPIQHEGRVIAVLNLASHTHDEIPMETRNALETIAAHIGGIIVRVTAEQALHKSEEFNRALVDNLADRIFAKDTKGRYILLNKVSYDFWGIPYGTALGKTDLEIHEQITAEVFTASDRVVFETGEPYSVEEHVKARDGRELVLSVIKAPMRDRTDRITGLVGISRDITELKRAEAQLRQYRDQLEDLVQKRTAELAKSNEQLRQEILERELAMREKEELHSQLIHAQKMEAIGTLAGGIAHDFNNLLQTVRGYAELLTCGKSEEEPGHRELKEITQAAKRGAELTQRLLTFGRKIETKRQPMDLNQQVERARKLLERTIPKMINIELSLAKDLKIAYADPTQIEQVLMNLAINAKDAMPEGGRMIIETANVVLDDEYQSAHFGARPGEYVQLTVSDTGSGMDRKTLERIFEPFFTTKAVGEGTGLGLAMVYGIVKSHDGYIMCYTEPGEGTTFKIYLPVIESELEVIEEEEKDLIRGGAETILLVDDEQSIRELGDRMLRHFGYAAFTAPDGESALEIYHKEHQRIDLVILDLIMPGMGGRKCLEEILEFDPDAKVLIASGYSVNGPAREAIDAGAKGFISKPYNMRQMLKTVRDVLDRD